MTKIIAPANQKGGLDKTTTAVNLGIYLVRQGKKVLLIDADSQGNMTHTLGWKTPDGPKDTLASVMKNIVTDERLRDNEAILHHDEGIGLMPANIELSVPEKLPSTIYSRETILRSYAALLLSEKLSTHLAEVDALTRKAVSQMVQEMAQQQGINEALKALDSMQWVGAMNMIKAQAEEIALAKYVYC